VRPKVSVRPAGPFATLAAMFIHRTTITGLSDRGAWPWRKPDCVRTWQHGAARAPAPHPEALVWMNAAAPVA